MRWQSLEQAQTAYKVIAKLAHSYGYLCSMYGSVLMDGQGDDLDLIFVPWRTEADEEGCVKAICDRFMARIVEQGHGAMKLTWSVLQMNIGLVLDLQFRAYPHTVADLLPELYPHGTCKLPPPGWYCTLSSGHSGPCPTLPEGRRPF